jgi:uncharacterized protein
MSDLIQLPPSYQGKTALYIEGAILAANLTVKPLEPELWAAELLEESFSELKASIVDRLNQQFLAIKANAYSAQTLLGEDKQGLTDFAEGFLTVWPTVEGDWQALEVADGTLRMLSALLTTMMLVMDEEATHAQMQQAGIEELPQLDQLLPQLDLMINEVGQAADEFMVGNKSQTVNPYKTVGRNDLCPCGSGQKFKKCCGA